MNQEDKDLAVLAYLRGHGSADIGEDHGAPATRQLPHDDVDTGLRALGYNRIERERLRRREPRLRNEAKFRATTVKRFEYYIGQKLTGRTPEQIARLAATWVGLTSYDLDLAQHCWAAGVDPGNPAQLVDAIEEGLRVENLGEVIAGRTIAEHLQAGTSLAWCLGALHWRQSA